MTSSVPFLHAAAAQPSNAALSLARSNPCPFAITKGFFSIRGPNAAIRARPSLNSKQTQSASVCTRPCTQSTAPKLPGRDRLEQPLDVARVANPRRVRPEGAAEARLLAEALSAHARRRARARPDSPSRAGRPARAAGRRATARCRRAARPGTSARPPPAPSASRASRIRRRRTPLAPLRHAARNRSAAPAVPAVTDTGKSAFIGRRAMKLVRNARWFGSISAPRLGTPRNRLSLALECISPRG